MKRHNLHTHTTYSDGILSPSDLIIKAQNQGIEVLGISDHAFAGKLPDDAQITNKLEQYVLDLHNIKSSLNGNLKLKIGAEIESDIMSTHPSQLPLTILNEFDYLLFEYIGLPAGRSITDIIKIRSKLNIPVGLAHNDLQFNYNQKESEIAKILADNDIFVELCQSEGLRNSRYDFVEEADVDFYRLFSKRLVEELFKYQVRVVIGTDTHQGSAVAEIDDVYQFIKENNLKIHDMIENDYN